MRCVAISDTHNRHKKITIPECDLLIHAGDYSFQGAKSEVENFYEWLGEQPAKHKISVQGNHERGVECDFEGMKAIATRLCPNVHFMDEGLVEIEGRKIWCSAWTPYFHNWAYNAMTTLEDANKLQKPYIKDIWDRIPDDTEILITHGPPYGVLDDVMRMNINWNVGCSDLMKRIYQLDKLKVHIFGHIHEGHGSRVLDGKHFYNVAICDSWYLASNPITEIEL